MGKREKNRTEYIEIGKNRGDDNNTRTKNTHPIFSSPGRNFPSPRNRTHQSRQEFPRYRHGRFLLHAHGERHTVTIATMTVFSSSRRRRRRHGRSPPCLPTRFSPLLSVQRRYPRPMRRRRRRRGFAVSRAAAAPPRRRRRGVVDRVDDHHQCRRQSPPEVPTSAAIAIVVVGMRRRSRRSVVHRPGPSALRDRGRVGTIMVSVRTTGPQPQPEG